MKKNALTALLVFSVSTGQLEAAPAWWNKQLEAAPAWWSRTTNKLRSIPGGIARKWHCVKNPDQYNCSPQERASAKLWITGAATVTIVAALSLVGIKVAASEIRKTQKLQIPEEEASSATQSAMYGIARDDLELVKKAVEEGADVNTQLSSLSGHTLLEYAIRKNDLNLINVLIGKRVNVKGTIHYELLLKADPAIKDAIFEKLRSITALNAPDPDGLFLLNQAVLQGDISTIQQLARMGARGVSVEVYDQANSGVKKILGDLFSMPFR